MNDVTTAPAEDATAQTPTMESLAAAIPDPQAGQQQTTQQPAAQPAAQPGTQQPGTQPAAQDNAAEMQQFIQQQQQQSEQMRQQIEDLTATQTELTSSIHREAVNKAVDDAVKTINDNVNGDPEMAEFFLSKAYNNDPNLQKIFQNREQFPEQYEKALGVLHAEWASKNQTTIDPQVAENQRALKASQQQSGGQPNQPSAEEEMEKMSDADFFAMGQRMAQNT